MTATAQMVRERRSADALVASLLELPAARGLALDSLVRLASIEWSTEITTACVECAASPRLLINPAFVARHCTTTRKLAFLILHELSHVSLGHTGLYTRATNLQNVTFDAVINASLLQGIRRRGAVNGWDELVCEIYSPTVSPLFILRPPPGWPDCPRWNASQSASRALRDIHRRLYAKRDRLEGVTYGEIMAARLQEAGERGGLVRLLGGHGATERERMAQSGGRDEHVVHAMSNVLGRLPHDPAWGSGSGSDPFALRIARSRHDDALVAALSRLLARALLDHSSTGRLAQSPVATWSVDSTRDRRAAIRRHVARSLGGPPPLLFSSESTRVRVVPDGLTAIYLDVSGSMSGVLEPLHASLAALRRMLAPRIFVFSTVVKEVSLSTFVRGEVHTTGGTSIDPVLVHLAEEAQAGRVRRAVLLTDGMFDVPSEGVLKRYLASGAQLHLGVTQRTEYGRASWVASETRLPDTKGGRSS